MGGSRGELKFGGEVVGSGSRVRGSSREMGGSSLS